MAAGKPSRACPDCIFWKHKITSRYMVIAYILIVA